MNRLEEKLYLEIVLDCEIKSCTEFYDPDIEANDPMDSWAKRNASLASASGWKINGAGNVLCPLCAKGI
jgi:hypothetical protein